MSTFKRKLIPVFQRRKASDSFDQIDNDTARFAPIDVAELVNEKIIFEAGLDVEERPIVIICGHYLPDTKAVDYDHLLSRILTRLRLFMDNDYVIVFFAGAISHRPSWSWIFKAYRALDHRQNVKALYVVHPSWWPRMILETANRIVSPKFHRKIHYVHTLSALAKVVPLNQIEIPPAVYEHNLKYEQEITLPGAGEHRQYGIPLEMLMGVEGEQGLPRVVKTASAYLRSTGLETEGLFRLSPSARTLKQAVDCFDHGRPVTMAEYGPHVACGLLKSFVRKLPVPLIPHHLYDTLKRLPPYLPSADVTSPTTRSHFIRNSIFPLLPTCNIVLLSVICHLLHDIALRSDRNQMDSYNLTIVWGPNLVESGDPLLDMSMCAVPPPPEDMRPRPSAEQKARVAESTIRGPPRALQAGGVGVLLQTCIDHYYEIFEEYTDPTGPIPTETDDAVTQFSSTSTAPSEYNTSSTSLQSDANDTIRSTSTRHRYASIRGLKGLLKDRASLSTGANAGSNAGVAGAGVEGTGAIVYGQRAE